MQRPLPDPVPPQKSVTPKGVEHTHRPTACRRRRGEEQLTCRELGIGFVAYSPPGRRFLPGQVKPAEEYSSDDVRRNHPRFPADNFDRNMQLLP